MRIQNSVFVLAAASSLSSKRFVVVVKNAVSKCALIDTDLVKVRVGLGCFDGVLGSRDDYRGGRFTSCSCIDST